MTRALERKYTVWMAGYYDDFLSAVAVPDNLNIPSGSWRSANSHHGNPINGWATLNPRYTYAWCERGDGDSARFNNSSVSADIQYTFNKGIGEWASLDTNRNNPGKWDGLVQIQYPDSLTNANRQKFDGGTGILGGSTKAYEGTTTDTNYAAVEGYALFCYGYDTSKRYYAAIGVNDSTFGRAISRPPYYNGGGIAPALEPEAGMPLLNSTTVIAVPAKTVRTHLAGVYSGEVIINDSLNNGLPQAALMPIESPSGKSFLVTEIYQTSTSAYDPIISYDGTLNSKGDGDIFTIRIYPMAVDPSTARIRLRIGCEGTAFTSVVGGDTGYTRAAIDYVITPGPFLETTSYQGLLMADIWDDYDFIMDYTNNQYDVVKNGTLILNNQTIANKADGTPFGAADMYGWELDAKLCAKKVAVLIDRVGLIRPLNDYPISTVQMPPAVSFSWTAASNSQSQLNLSLIDDDAQLKLLAFFNQSSYADWSLLLFRDNIDRPLWRGTIQSLAYSNDANSRTPKIDITATDYFVNMDKQIPTWEMGQGGEGDRTAQVAYDRTDSQNEINTYFLGTSILDTANQTLGFNEVEDGNAVWKSHLDTRMRNRSAHPIQMYLGEDTTTGPNDPYVDWDAAITAGYATSAVQYRVLHSRWMKDLPKSLWFTHMFSKISKDPSTATGLNNVGISTLGANFSVGDSTITLSDYSNNMPDGGSIELIGADGFVDSGVYSGVSSTRTAANCIIRVYEQKYPTNTIQSGEGAGQPNPQRTRAHISNRYGQQPGYKLTIHLLVPQTGTTLNEIWPNKNIGITGAPTSQPYGIADGAQILNDDWTTLGGPNRMIPCSLTQAPGEITVNGVDYYVFPLRNTTSNKSEWVEALGTGYPTGVAPTLNGNYSWLHTGTPSITRAQISDNYNHVGLFHRINAEYTGITVKYGATVLNTPTTNFFQRNHVSGDQFNLRSLDKTDYKHIWVLWSDMRNDGLADADTSFRKKQFGLMTPYSGNYEVTLGIADSDISATEEREKFVDLKIGEDLDMWQMDATADPITGVSWSAVTNGSDSESNSKYHNWEEKAGSFVIIDTSKFFNLNTVSNGGRTGQDSGGRKEIGDFLVETEGNPILIDNYWAEAPITYENNLDFRAYSPNMRFFINNPTTLATGIQVDGSGIGDKIIQLTDVSAIPEYLGRDSAGATIGQAGSIVSEKKKTILHYASIPATTLEGRPNCTIAPLGAGIATITDSGAAGHPIGMYYREGHKIEITNSTTTPSIDGLYEILGRVAANPTSPYHATTTFTINLKDPTVTVSTGTVTVSAPNSRSLYNLVSLGKIVVGTNAPGEWNGAGYGTSQNNAYYLTYIGGTGSIPLAGTGATVSVNIDPDDTASYSDALVYGTLANVFPMRLLMAVNGFIENKGSGTWYHSDKYRTLYSDSLAKTWLEQTKLSGIPNIANIPQTKQMATVQSSAEGLGRGGRIGGISAPSSGSSIVSTASGVPHGLEIGDTVTLIDVVRLTSIGIGAQKDYIITATPNPNEMTITNAVSVVGSGSYGRWFKGGSIDDFGGVNDCRNATITTVFSSTQALSGIGNDYGVNQVFTWLMGRDSKPSYRPNYYLGLAFDTTNLKLSNLKTESRNQVTNVRVFYGGNGLFIDYPVPTLGTTPRWKILSVPSIGTNAEALKVAKTEYEKNKMAPLSIDAEIITFPDTGTNTFFGDKTVMLDGARYGYVADQSRTIPRSFAVSGSAYTEDKSWAWTSLWNGNLFPGMVSALDGRDGNADSPNQNEITYNNNYFWYGANSLSYAVQVVHIPRNMPKTTMKSAGVSKINADGKLRMVVEVGDGTNFEYAATASPMFTIKLIDYDWVDGTYVPTAMSSSVVTVDSNGYYQLDIPSTYWTGRAGNERIIISVNYDYLLAVTKNRGGTGDIKNANVYAGSGLFGSTLNAESLFPLGMRKYATGDYWNIRAEWYAPRLHVCDDINFVPATQVWYTDPALELSSEVMGIKSVSWNVTARKETVKFRLERDVSRNMENFASLFLPPVSKGGVQTNEKSGDNETIPPAQKAGYDGINQGGFQDAGGYGGMKGVTGDNYDATGLVGTGFNVDGVNLTDNKSLAISSNILSSNLLKRMKGSMDFNNDSVTGGAFSVLGQKKPTAAPRNDNGIEGIDSFIIPTSGDGLMSTNGMSFAGASDAVKAYNEFTTTVRVPPSSKSDQVNISGRYSLDATSGQVGYLEVKVECVETGIQQTINLTLKDGTNSAIAIFNGGIYGASESGNTLKITIGREAGTSPDTAKYSSLTLHNIQIGFDTQSVSGKTQANKLSYSD